MASPTLRDGDLVLRPKRPDDVDAITAACQDPEIPRWTFVPSPYTRADAEAFLARSAEEEAAGKTVHLLAVDVEDDRLLGSFSLMELDLELTKMDILPHKDNAPSRRVAEKAGFRDTGELVGSPRAGIQEPIYARYVWERT